MKEKISILIHGYTKNKKDMNALLNNLEKLNHKCILVDLPLTYKEIEHGCLMFEGMLDSILKDLNQNENINVIGHSTGGLIIRKCLLSTKNIDRIDNCVLIATPNNGSELADIASKYFNIGTYFFKTLRSLKKENVKMIQLDHDKSIRIGAIAGNRNNLLLGKLLSGENDGRVKVSSVYYEGLDDFTILPYGHKEIHYKWETAKVVDHFIETGKFI